MADPDKWFKIRLFIGISENDFKLMRLLGDDGKLIDDKDCSVYPHKNINTVGRSVRAYLDSVDLPPNTTMKMTLEDVRREYGMKDSDYWEAFYHYCIDSPAGSDHLSFVVMFGKRTELAAKQLKTRLDKHLKREYSK